MTYLTLFLSFLKIGAISFGGGYGMIAVLKEEVLLHGWMSEEKLLDFIAVSESTPGPLAVNMATFVGAAEGGFFGAFVATLGVILPSFLIILLIASVLRNLLRYRGVQAFLGGVRPCVAGLVTATALLMLLSALLGVSNVTDTPSPDLYATLIFACLAVLSFGYRKIFKKRPSPILLILCSAGLGIALYGS